MMRFYFKTYDEDAAFRNTGKLKLLGDRLTCLSVVRLKVLQQLFLLHDFILSLIQLNPEDTDGVSLPPSTGQHMHSFRTLFEELTHSSHLHVRIKFPLQV